MFPLFETIRIQENACCNIAAHQLRLEESYFAYYGVACVWRLEEVLKNSVDLEEGRLKFSYNKTTYSIATTRFIYQAINTLKLIECNDIEYSLKYSDRSVLDHLFKQRGEADDILIIKHGFITDTSTCNIVFFDGQRWVTPNTPLLKGTQRAWLLQQNMIEERSIAASAYSSFKSFQLINALRPFAAL